MCLVQYVLPSRSNPKPRLTPEGLRKSIRTSLHHPLPAPIATTASRAPTMSISSSTARPLACIKQALRQCRAERQQQRRTYAAAASEALYPSLQTRYPPPAKGFRPSIATKQNRASILARHTDPQTCPANTPQASKKASKKSPSRLPLPPPEKAAPTPSPKSPPTKSPSSIPLAPAPASSPPQTPTAQESATSSSYVSNPATPSQAYASTSATAPTPVSIPPSCCETS